jgi:hypothetical protein
METIDLARALVAHPKWEWRPGMLWEAGDNCPLCHGAGGFRWMEADGSENGERCPCSGRFENYDQMTKRDMRGAVVCLDDPATAGVLLDMLETAQPIGVLSVDREMYDEDLNPGTSYTVSVMVGGERRQRRRFSAKVKGEAIARALLAVWGARPMPHPTPGTALARALLAVF